MTSTASERDAGTRKLRRRGIPSPGSSSSGTSSKARLAVTAGLTSRSIALVGFGIDSSIEVFAASVVLWQLRRGAQARQRPALRAIAVTFFLLAGYVAVQAVRDLAAGADAEESIVGIVLSVGCIVAMAVMVPVAVALWRRLGNDVLVAQAKQTWLSNRPVGQRPRRPGPQSRARMGVG